MNKIYLCEHQFDLNVNGLFVCECVRASVCLRLIFLFTYFRSRAIYIYLFHFNSFAFLL